MVRINMELLHRLWLLSNDIPYVWHRLVANLEINSYNFDGSLMKRGADAGLVFIWPLRIRMKYAVRLHFPTSNNVAEYKALINGLRIAIEFGI